MGWARGSEVARDMIEIIKNYVVADTRKIIYGKMYDSLRSMDWDTVDEAMGIDPVFDEVVREKEADWFDRDYWM